jgi:hypothetical protein
MLVLLAACVLQPAAAQQQPAGSAATPQRDVAAASVARNNFVVARVGRECLAHVGRSESPQAFISTWQQRNAPFVAASSKYLDRRVEEAEAEGGTERGAQVQREIRATVQRMGEADVQTLLQGRKEDSCMRAVTLVEAGAFDILPRMPEYQQIEALVRWAER